MAATKPSVARAPEPEKVKPKPKVRSKKAQSEDLGTLSARWTSNVTQAGWTGVPNMLLYNQHDLKLSDGELVILLNILSHWRAKGSSPFVAKKTIATRMGKHHRTVQAHLKTLCSERIVASVEEPVVLVSRRERFDGGRQLSSGYSFEGLIKVLKIYASKEIAERKFK